MNIREIIKTLIDVHGFKQHELATIAEISAGRISHIYTSPDDKPATCSFEAGERLAKFLSELQQEQNTELKEGAA